MSLLAGFVALLGVPVFLAGCYNEPVENLAVWSEFLPLTEVRGHLDTLARFGADLYLAVRPDDLNDELRGFVSDARAAGVNVRYWLQLPDNGIWVNETNAGAFVEFTSRLFAWAEGNGAPVEWVIFDMEPSIEYVQALRQAAQAGGVPALLELLNRHRQPDEFAAARQLLQQAVDEVHLHGARAMSAVLPWMIDDLEDGDADLQDMFDTPVAGITWDQVSVMLYRPIVAELAGLPITPAYVTQYAQALKSWYPAGAQVALGPVASAGVGTPPGYTDPLHLAMDVSAARSAGVDDISVFSLDGMVMAGGPEAWLSTAAGPTLRCGYLDLVVPEMHQLTVLFDRQIGE